MRSGSQLLTIACLQGSCGRSSAHSGAASAKHSPTHRGRSLSHLLYCAIVAMLRGRARRRVATRYRPHATMPPCSRRPAHISSPHFHSSRRNAHGNAPFGPWKEAGRAAGEGQHLPGGVFMADVGAVAIVSRPPYSRSLSLRLCVFWWSWSMQCLQRAAMPQS